MDQFKKILSAIGNIAMEVVKNRRLIAAVFSYVITGLAFFGIVLSGNAEQLTEAIVGIFIGLGSMASGTLALISYLQPKKIQPPEDQTNG
jgi:UDP-N-acetylmuramyl pentapeptide phosphotransferase/UDP-N-acetylglucosamine-1-phosphate transferase